ncbi:MAG: PQQ-binding-like beta-propeller repeat protein [Verrucomicrobia bacterium]|nr:PQQ-binding-like beta-propeller repeat protein [Verrucomicrobiota bacterium]
MPEPSPTLSPPAASATAACAVRLERAALLTAVVAGLFCAVLVVGMIVVHVRSTLDDPLNAPHMAALKSQLAASPKDEALKRQIRELDLDLRRSYFRQLSMNHVGGWMLLAGFGVLLLAANKVRQLRQLPPAPHLNPNAAEQAARRAAQARGSLAGLAVALALASAALALVLRPAVPARPGDLQRLLARNASPAPAPPSPPPAAESKNHWPRFRGPDGNGIALHTNVLLQWDVAAGTGLLWKTPVPAPGFNSPIVWNDRIFMSGGDKQKREVMCFDLESGKLLWQRAVDKVPGSPAELPEVPEMTGFAAPTMATDGQRAYVIFANGDVAAFGFDGALAWATNLGVPHNPHGHASSLAMWQDRLLVQLDHGNPDEHLSKLLAFDGATGSVLWQRARPVGDSWASPIVIDTAGTSQVIALGLPWLIAHDPADGSELWRADCLEGEVTPSPVFADDRLFVVSPNIYLMAIRPDGRGDVTKTHILWKAEDGIPDIGSPVSNGELVFVVNTPGMLTCYDARDGKKLWEHDYETEVNASPTLVGRRLYLFTVDGAALVVEAARAFKEIARSAMGEKVFASPAFVRNRIIVRGARHLFCLGTAGDQIAQAP